MNAVGLSLVIFAAKLMVAFGQQCIADPNLDAEFGDYDLEGSCCQEAICLLGCPEQVDAPNKGFGIAVVVAIGVFVIVGFLTVFLIKGKNENYFVAGRSLPLWVIVATLASQAIDSNAILGNADLSYKYHFFDGAVLPIGLGLSLILNAVFFAQKINVDKALTLPDVFAKRYGKLVELLVSLCTITSFLCLLAGNLVGMGAILSYLLDISKANAIWISAALVLVYTIAGGLFSVAYTDCLQALVGWLGCMTLAFYMIRNSEDSAPPPSIGYPDYIYPDQETCDMYDGVPCSNNATLCCYNIDQNCPNGIGSADCVIDNGAYPIGDLPMFSNQLLDEHALYPFPNAILWNWSTVFILAFGNLAALDFQARCMASKTPRIAVIGCLLAGCLTFLVGIPFAYLGAITRTYYGPDTARAEFAADTCSVALGLPTCALWLPDPQAFIKLLTHEAPAFLGGWCLIGIVAASMSTSDGAILAMGTVFTHNIIRNVDAYFSCCFNMGGKKLITNDNLLNIARLVSIPVTAIAATVAAYYESSHSAGATGYLLIVAFDVMLASVVVPLFGCFYTKKPSPLAALLSLLAGVAVRVILEYSLPKDGFLLAPFKGDEFLDYGPAANSKVPPFWDFPAEDAWDPADGACDQVRFADWTGLDSLAAPLVSLVVFVIIQFLERNGPLFKFSDDGIMVGYLKEGQGDDDDAKVLEDDLALKEEAAPVSTAPISDQGKVDENNFPDEDEMSVSA
mmetsp:Transcript_4087/g.5876  ORF Transcript_4087/g.5876 Transcript_4087/m.5876 type:complete len:737 (+) Transcript_4087:428-2638(+)